MRLEFFFTQVFRKRGQSRITAYFCGGDAEATFSSHDRAFPALPLLSTSAEHLECVRFRAAFPGARRVVGDDVRSR